MFLRLNLKNINFLRRFKPKKSENLLRPKPNDKPQKFLSFKHPSRPKFLKVYLKIFQYFCYGLNINNFSLGLNLEIRLTLKLTTLPKTYLRFKPQKII